MIFPSLSEELMKPAAESFPAVASKRPLDLLRTWKLEGGPDSFMAKPKRYVARSSPRSHWRSDTSTTQQSKYQVGK